MKKNVINLEPDEYYHIFNKGINGCAIFFAPTNYIYFLNLIEEKIGKIADIHCFCLMPNHFHLLVKIKSEHYIRDIFFEKKDIDISKIISQQFSNAFNSYTQAINKSFARTGKLFELPFRRILIKDSEQLIKTVLYIHANPAKHKIDRDIFNYKYSSLSMISQNFDKNVFINNLFDDVCNFKNLHLEYLKKY